MGTVEIEDKPGYGNECGDAHKYLTKQFVVEQVGCWNKGIDYIQKTKNYQNEGEIMDGKDGMVEKPVFFPAVK